MRILVQTLKKENIEIDVEGNTVGFLRQEIMKAKNIPADMDLKIIFNGKILEKDEQTFEEVGIKENCNKVVILVKNKPAQPPAASKQTSTTPTPAPASTSAPASTPAPTSAPASSAPLTTQTGGPVNLFDLAAQTQANPQVANNGLPGIPDMGFDAAMFQQLLMGNPQVIQQMLMQNPEFQQALQQNPQELEQLLANPEFMQQMMQAILPAMGAMGQMGGGMPGSPIIIQLTEEERLQLQQLEDLGVTTQEALYYYESCGRDINAAANMILQDLDDPNNQYDDEEGYDDQGQQ
jgi:hypothetical protein